MEISQLNALDAVLAQLSGASFSMGPEWEATHELCQGHEGESLFDAAHALCHRIEGDDRNAGYWYRRAGRSVPTGGFEDECAGLREDIDRARA